MTDLLDTRLFWLTVGDPGPLPWPMAQPLCDGMCTALDSAASTPSTAAAEPAAEMPAGFWAMPGVTPPAVGPSELLDGLRSSVDALAGHGPLSGSRADTGALLDLTERVRSLALRELAEMDATGGHLRPGVNSATASWLRDQQHLSDGAARATVGLATALRDDLPGVGGLLADGGITVEHAAAVVSGVRGLDGAVVREAEDGLCALAQVTDPPDLRKRLRDKAAAIDDRLAAEAGRRARDRMGLRFNDVGAHTAVDGTLASDSGAMVRLAMDIAIEAAREDGDKRSKAARQADVLVSWATDYLARQHGPGDSLADDAHTVRTHLHVICRPEQLPSDTGVTDAGSDAGSTPAGSADTGPADTGPADTGPAAQPDLSELLARDLAGEPPAAPGILGDNGPLSRGALRRLACDATIHLSVLHGPGLHACADTAAGRVCRHLSDPLHIGRSTRTVSGLLFRALVVRDRTCVAKGCRRRPAQCAAHHVRHWADGGDTDLDNLVLLCHQHHHDHHDRGLDLPHRDGVRWLTAHGWAHAPP